MDAINAMTSRLSAPALVPPEPDAATLDRIFAAAANAPDHGKLRPFRFIVIRGRARLAFGEVCAEAMKRREPSADATMLDRERQKALRAPMIVVVAAKVTTPAKIPEIEQVLAAGAAAQNVFLAAHAEGFGAMWKTGAPAYDPYVKLSLGLGESDAIVGFIYLGRPDRPLPPRVAKPATELVSEWTAPLG
jgi:nitroreductase